jgi:hypothetical protein
MAGPSDGVIETAKVREVAGVFHSHGALEDAVDDLLRAGFDRADIDVIGDLEELRKRLGDAYVAPEELADVPQAPRRPFFARDDLTETVILVASTIGGAAATAAALAVIASEGSWVSALVAGAVTGVIAAGVAAVLIARYFERERVRGLEWYAAARGLILWVRVRDREREDEAQEILLRHGAEAVRVHEVEIAKRVEDIPLSSLRPDPWLGERLGDVPGETGPGGDRSHGRATVD